MNGLHTKKTIVLAYTVSFLAILGCLLLKQRADEVASSDSMATELDLPEVSQAPTTFEEAVQKKLARPTKNRARFPVDVSATPENNVYHIYTAQGLDDFVTMHTDKPVVVKFANKKACSPCKATEPTYLLSAKWLDKDAYFADIDENEFDDLEYFAELAPTVPAFKIYVDGELTPVKDFQGLKTRTRIRDELKDVEQEQMRKKAAARSKL
jgi:thiol-disulfide isomerase/thioredoxin